MLDLIFVISTKHFSSDPSAALYAIAAMLMAGGSVDVLVYPNDSPRRPLE